MRPRGPTIPVKHLFLLLAYVGVTQRDVRERLGVHKSLTSFWATGQRPMPERHLPAILDLLDEAIARRSPMIKLTSTSKSRRY